MKRLNIIVEGSTEESFVNDVLVEHFSALNISVSARKIKTGWNNSKPAKGGLTSYLLFRNDVLNWIESDRKNPECWYTSMIDLYAFPKKDSPFTTQIQNISNCHLAED